jgi:hypothetical protein
MKQFYIESRRKDVIKRRKADWIVHILLINCLIKHVIEGQIEGMG